ncbi:hypothetical protein JX266_013150 [Neoarthrinium moseri]|nr:hypothetical protein JX266_013150 [Neoarthrinium moseri]
MAASPLASEGSLQINTERNGDGFQYYDQVCALSQDVINKNFEKLFARRNDLAKVDWEGPNAAIGHIKGILLAPQVVLSLESATDPEILYMLRFGKDSKIYFSSNSNIDISGWNIALTAKMKMMTASVDPTLSKADQTRARDAMDELEEIVEFDFERPTKLVPGEYSIHRIYAAIPLDKESVSYAPKDLYLQNYPYVSPERKKELKAEGRAMAGKTGDDYNCFCYSEIVDGRKAPMPDTKTLLYSGNFAAPPTSGSGGYGGTFILDRRFFLERHLLPQLEGINAASQIIPLRPLMEVDEYRDAVFKTRICSGTNPEDAEDRADLPPLVSKEPSFKFTYTGSQTYEWKTLRWAPGSGESGEPDQNFVMNYEGSKQYPFFRRYKTKSTTSTKVSWVPGTDQFKVEGRCEYDHWEAWSQNRSDFPYGTGQDIDGGGKYYWGTFTDVATWSFIIDLDVSDASKVDPSVPNGVIEPTILKCKIERDPITKEELLLPEDFKVEVGDMKWVLDSTHLNIVQAMKYSIGIGLGRAARNLETGFVGIGKFMYPGAGELAFGKPCITEHGHIVAAIDYIEPKEDRVRIVVPRPEQLVSTKPDKSVTYSSDPSASMLKLRLSWTLKETNFSTYMPPKPRFRLVLQATNRTNSDLCFVAIRVIVHRMKNMEDQRLYIAPWSDWKQNLAPIQQEPVLPPTTISDPSDTKVSGTTGPATKDPVTEEPVTTESGTDPSITDSSSGGKAPMKDSPSTQSTEQTPNQDGPTTIGIPASTHSTMEPSDVSFADLQPQGNTVNITTKEAEPAGKVSASPTAIDKANTGGSASTAQPSVLPPPPPKPAKKPTETWDLQTEDIEDDTQLEVRPELVEDEFHFNILPVAVETGPNGNPLPDRFTLTSEDASNFTLELNGTTWLDANGTGNYVIQIKEIWEKRGKLSAGSGNEYLLVSFTGGTQVKTKWISQEEADKCRGVEITSVEAKK